jgi:hypothetical protein
MAAVGLASAALALTALGASQSYPPIQLPPRPTPLPALPESFSPFTPPVSSVHPHPDAPAIAEWTRSNIPGDTLALTGSRLSAFVGAEAGRDSRFVVFGQSAQSEILSIADIQRVSGQQAAITLPETLPTPAMYVVWPVNDHGAGPPALLNQTETWWIGPDTATRGDIFSVFGRNLTAGEDKTNCWIYLQAGDDSGRWLTSVSANPYKADFVIPADTASGTYRAWAHNSLGQEYGWSGPLELTIDDGMAWTGPTIDVTAYGATGDGITDDIDAIDAAIEAADNTPGSTVYFPAGTYMISHVIRDIPDDTRLRGAGIDQTTIAAHPGFTTNYYGMLFGRMDRVTFEDFTLDTRANVSGILDSNIAYVRDSSRLEFSNIRFRQRRKGTSSFIVDAHNCEMVTFRNCTFIASKSTMLGDSQQVFVEDCDFRGVHDNNTLIYSWGGSEISIINCTAADYDNTTPDGWCQGRFFAGNGAWGPMQDIYFGDNRTIDMTVRPEYEDQNTGEQFMLEHLETWYRGTAIDAGMDTIQLPNLTHDLTRCVLVLVDGTGMGQYRTITAFDPDSGTLTVHKPWRVIPQTDTVAMIGNYMARTAVYNNTFDGKERGVTNASHLAATGVQPYGGCVDLVVARNRFHQLRTGISSWSIGHATVQSDRLTIQPNYFNLFVDNDFERCRKVSATRVGIWEALPVEPDIAVLANVFRRNRINDVVQTVFTSRSMDEASTIELCIFDQNTATNVATAVTHETGSLMNHILVRNRFHGGGGAAMELQTDDCPVLRENIWDGFEVQPTECAPAAILEVPQRILDLSCPAGQAIEDMLHIWNSGTLPLNWQATTTSSWLEVCSPHGTVPDEHCSGALRVRSHAADLEPGLYRAVVTIEAEDQAQQITVVFNATAPDNSAPPILAFDNPELAETGVSILQWLTDHGIETDSTVDMDSDADGCSLIEEYALGLDPTVMSREGMPRLEAGTEPGTIQFVFNRARAGLGYAVERCTDLRNGNWTTIAMNPGSPGDLVVLPVTTEAGTANGFFRLAISSN